MRVKAALIGGSVVVLGFVTGCAAPEGQVTQIAPNTADLQIQRIKNEKNMPEDQKAAAIARLQSRPMPGGPGK